MNCSRSGGVKMNAREILKELEDRVHFEKLVEEQLNKGDDNEV